MGTIRMRSAVDIAAWLRELELCAVALVTRLQALRVI
jgi:hypothetical protein